MKVEILKDGPRLRLEAQSGADLEKLFNLVELGGPVGWVARERTLESGLPFKRDFDSQGLAYITTRGVEVLWALELNLDWLRDGAPANAESQLRANAASRLGHSMLDAFELVCRNPQ